MARTSCLAAVLLVALTPQSAAFGDPATPVLGRLRWVRGEVAAVSGDSLTLKLRNKPLTLSLDGTPPPAVGAIVEAHFTDKRGARRTALIFDADRSSELSKRPGTSYRGVIRQIKRSRLSLTADTKSHGISLAKKTRLVDADGHAVATGTKAIAGLLPAGEDVLVKYEDDGGMIMVGDMMLAAGSDRAQEIRRLR